MPSVRQTFAKAERIQTATHQQPAAYLVRVSFTRAGNIDGRLLQRTAAGCAHRSRSLTESALSGGTTGRSPPVSCSFPVSGSATDPTYGRQPLVDEVCLRGLCFGTRRRGLTTLQSERQPDRATRIVGRKSARLRVPSPRAELLAFLNRAVRGVAATVVVEHSRPEQGQPGNTKAPGLQGGTRVRELGRMAVARTTPPAKD